MKYQDRLKALREDKDLSQTDVARVLNVAQTTYSQYELGKRALPIEYIGILCEFYDVSSDYILGLSDNLKR